MTKYKKIYMKKPDLFILKKTKEEILNDEKIISKVNPRIKPINILSPKSLTSSQKNTVQKNQKKTNGFNTINNSFSLKGKESTEKENIIDSSFISNSLYNSGRWSKEEHHKFLKGLIQYGNDWKMVQKIIKTRTSSQSRSHAQKFFLKLRNLIRNKKIYDWDNLYDIIYNKNKDI